MVGDDEKILSGFTAKDGWKVLRLVGRQGDLLEDVGSLLKCRRTEKAVCSALQREAETLSKPIALAQIHTCCRSWLSLFVDRIAKL